MDNRARGTGLEMRIECWFRVKYAVTSHSGLSGVKVAALGIHQFTTDQTIQKVSLRMVSVWHQRCNSTQVLQFQGYIRLFGQPKHAFIYDSGAKLTTLGIHRSNGTRGEPQNSPCAAPEVQQQKQRNLHSIKGHADTPYIRNIGRRMRFQSSSPRSVIHAPNLEHAHIAARRT